MEKISAVCKDSIFFLSLKAGTLMNFFQSQKQLFLSKALPLTAAVISAFALLAPSISLAESQQKAQIASQQEQKEESDAKSLQKSKRQAKCSRKMGSKYYQEYGDAMHRYRYPSELTPAEWHTTMLFHRVKIPLTGPEYCSLVDFFNANPKDLSCSPAETCPNDAENCPVKKEASPSKLEELKQSVDDLSCRPSEATLADSNFLIKGTAFVNFNALSDHNNSFEAGLNPIFLWRWKDKILYEMELELHLDEDCSTEIGIEYTTIDYIANDYLIFRAGKFLLPLGFWKEKMHPEWINKLPTPPLPYVPEEHTIIPTAELGLDIRGAAPIGKNPWNDHVAMVLAYDFWVGNGPDQNEDGDIRLSCNYNDNNNNKAIGARLSFRPWPYRVVEVSGYRGQWNSNKHGGDVISHRDLFYNAVVADADWHFGAYYRIMGEYMWTKRGAVINPDIGITANKVYVHAAWAQLSSTLGMFKFPYCDNFELVLRYGWIDSRGSTDKRRQWSYGANYYLTDTMVIKLGFDQNRGHLNHDDRLTVQWAYGY